MKFKCSVCGNVLDNEAPEVCPRCGAKKEMYKALSDDAAKLIDKARYTNNLHMELESRLTAVALVAENGIKDNLDPTCVKIFNYAKEQATIIRQMIKAEIVVHIEKGKWG